MFDESEFSTAVIVRCWIGSKDFNCRTSLMMDEKTFSKMTRGRSRVVIEHLSPEIDGGRHPVKRVSGEPVVVEAHICADGHDILSAVLKFRHGQNRQWSEVPMKPIVCDRCRGTFTPADIGGCFYTVEEGVDHFLTWRNDLKKRVKAGQEVRVQGCRSASAAHRGHIMAGRENYVRLDPAFVPAAIFSLRRRVRTERDLDYFL